MKPVRRKDPAKMAGAKQGRKARDARREAKDWKATDRQRDHRARARMQVVQGSGSRMERGSAAGHGA